MAESGWYREAKLSPLYGTGAFYHPFVARQDQRDSRLFKPARRKNIKFRKGGGLVESDLEDLELCTSNRQVFDFTVFCSRMAAPGW